MLRTAPIRTKVIAVLVVPLVGLLVLAAAGIGTTLARGAEAHRVNDLAQLAVRGDALVHELQAERTLSSGLVAARASKAAVPRDGMVTQRVVVDRTVAAFTAFAAGLDTGDYDPKLRQALDRAVREAGGYHHDTVAEDADLTMALLRNGYRVEYEDRALAFTEAPVNANGLMRQRFRWSFGILQAVWKHSGVFARKGVLGWVALPNILVFQILLPIVSPLIDVMFVVGAMWYLIQKFFHPESTDPASFQRLLIFFVVFLVIDLLASAIAFALERRQPDAPEDGWLLSQVWLQRFAYRQLFSIVLLKTLKRAIEGRPFAWDKLERTAAVSVRPSEQRESVKV